MIDIEQFSLKGELFDGHYKLLHPLSTDGATADVWLAMDVNTIDADWGDIPREKSDDSGMLVAIKIYRPKNALDIEGEQRFREEFKIVYECRHANLLQPTAFSIYEETPYLVMPYCRYGSSEQLIGKKVSELEVWKFVLDVASGLNRLHTNNPQIIHQDIKPANILIDNTRNYAITDFGISAKKGGAQGFYYDENSGTYAYMAPERFQSESEALPQSDIWAFGATLFEILTGTVPFGEEGGKAQLAGVKMGALTGVSPSIQRLVHACLEKEPGNRPSAQQLIDAARARCFPVRKRQIPILVIIFVLFVGLGVTALGFMNSAYYQEFCYEKALEKMKSDDGRLFKDGYHSMEVLSRKSYIPALYELAVTHGYDSSPESRHRKKMLQIKTNDKYCPTEDIDNQKTIVWLQEIISISDDRYPEINAYAAYRLSGYYVNRDDQDFVTGIKFMQISKEWAERVPDDSLISKTNYFLRLFENELSKKERIIQ